MAGFFSKKQYAAIADKELAMKLQEKQSTKCSCLSDLQLYIYHLFIFIYFLYFFKIILFKLMKRQVSFVIVPTFHYLCVSLLQTKYL